MGVDGSQTRLRVEGSFVVRLKVFVDKGERVAKRKQRLQSGHKGRLMDEGRAWRAHR